MCSTVLVVLEGGRGELNAIYELQQVHIKEENNKTTMLKDIISYFSITTKTKVMVFDNESIQIRFSSP